MSRSNAIRVGGALAAAVLAAAAGAAVAQVAVPEPPMISTHPVGGEQTFVSRCGYCHLPMGTGTMMLARREGQAKALLADRTDLQPAYIRYVVRNGQRSMPAITRTEVTDPELAEIVAYLTRNRAAKP